MTNALYLKFSSKISERELECGWCIIIIEYDGFCGMPECLECQNNAGMPGMRI